MESNQSLIHADERARCALLRESVLRYGHLIGWTHHAAIAFAERVSRRPWKRCTSEQLAEVVSELRDVHRAFEVRRLAARIVFDEPGPAVGAQGAPLERGNGGRILVDESRLAVGGNRVDRG